MNSSNIAKTIVFYTVALALGLSYIIGKDLVLEAKSPVIGSMLVLGATFLISFDIYQWIKKRKGGK